MHKVTNRLLWALAFLLAVVLVWRKLRIVILVHLHFWQLLLLFVALAVAIYVVFEVLLGRLGDR